MGTVTPKEGVAGHIFVPTQLPTSAFGNAAGTAVATRVTRRRLPLPPSVSSLSLHPSNPPRIPSSSATGILTATSHTSNPASAVSSIRNPRLSITTSDPEMTFFDAFSIIAGGAFCLALWVEIGFATPTEPTENLERGLAGTAVAAVATTNQDVVWFAVASMLAIGLVKLGREIAREWGIEMQERKDKREDEKQERKEKREDEKEERKEKREDEKEERKEKREDEKEERKEKREDEKLKREEEKQERQETRAHEISIQGLKVRELELQVELEKLKKAV